MPRHINRSLRQCLLSLHLRICLGSHVVEVLVVVRSVLDHHSALAVVLVEGRVLISVLHLAEIVKELLVERRLLEVVTLVLFVSLLILKLTYKIFIIHSRNVVQASLLMFNLSQLSRWSDCLW